MFIRNSAPLVPGVRVAVGAALVLSLPAMASQASLQPVDEVVVTATREAERVSSVLADVTVLQRGDIERSGAATLEELLARQPGISFASNGGPGAFSSLFVRGTNSSHVLLLVDGIRWGGTGGAAPNWSRVPLSQIERIEIVRGPLSSLYGSDAIGGVVQVFTRGGTGRAGLDAALAFGSRETLKGDLSWAGQHERWTYAFTLANEQTAGIDASGKDSFTVEPDRDRFDMHSASFRVGHELTRAHQLALSFLSARGENEYDSGDPATPDASNRVRSSNLSVQWRAAWTQDWDSELRLGRSVDDAEQRSREAPTGRDRTVQQQFGWHHSVKSRWGRWLVGVERLEQELDSTSSYDATERSINAVFAGWRGQFGAHALQLNARRDHNSQFGKKQTGSLGYGFRFNDRLRGSLSYGTAFKAPTFTDLYYPFTCFGSFGCFQGNAALRPEQSRNREAALHHEQDGRRASLVWFLNHVSDLIVGSGSQPVNLNKARIEGWSFAYDVPAVGLDWRMQLDYLRPVDATTDELLQKRPRRQALVAVGRSAGEWAWRVEAQGRSRRVDWGQEMGGYAVVNAHVSRSLPQAGWSVFAKVDNMFDRQYELSRGFRTPGITTLVGVRYGAP